MNVLQPQRIQELSDRPVKENSPVLSVYLDLDPANTGNRRSGHKLALESMLKEIESQISDTTKLVQFKEDAEWIRQKAEFHLPKGRSFVLFSDASESFHFQEDLPVRMANQAWYGSTPYVRPLLEALKEYERYGVVLVDSEKARFFVISMGNIEEVSDFFQYPPVKHRATAGSDHMRSQMVLQRRAAKWSESFLKDVSDILHDLIAQHDIDRVILGGSDEVSAELHRLLPRAVAGRVAARVKLSVTAKAREVLEISNSIIDRFDREQERFIVGDLITIAKKAKPTVEKAVVGMNATLDAVNQGRVHRLVYPSDLKVKGYRCGSCDVLMDHAPADGICPYCSNNLEDVEDMIWLVSERVLGSGGKIEEIKDDEARSRLMSAGGIGASLR